MLKIDQADLDIVLKIAKMEIPDAKIFAFGSRVYGEPRDRSDFDIAVSGATPEHFQQFKDYLSVAPTSIRIDASNYDYLADWLRQIVDEKGEQIFPLQN
ncbi:MAG: nucleotidyltransferase domain-containing protein [Candidatus Nomurabacteria bacterium]|jgi:predicted nucleotidyltransferase|nr:nucleotidyltransferase domain-containing protein [Candidatus Nomurabacteria bacterium]